MKFSRIKNGLLATAAAGVLAVGISGEAQAFPPGAGAYGLLMVDNFAFIPVSVWYWCGLTGFCISSQSKGQLKSCPK